MQDGKSGAATNPDGAPWGPWRGKRDAGRPWWLGYLDTDADRSWLMSWLWDDTWRCLGGPAALIDRFADEPRLQVRRAGPGEGATPPGHVAY